MGFPFLREKEKPEEIERRIYANDPERNATYQYANNFISTSKYTWFTYLPKNLFEQFQRLANFYFLCLAILQFMPVISSLTPITTVLPLIFVLVVSGLKDLIDDYYRHQSDNTVNSRSSSLLARDVMSSEIKKERWENVQVGDIILMENGEFIAADLLLLSTSDENGLCYIETAELDGETNLKVRQALPETAELKDDLRKMSEFKAELICEPPNNRLSKFEGTLNWNNKRFALNNDKILLRGCVLRNTEWAFGLVVFAGKDTKLMMNSGKAIFKRTSIDKLMNFLIIGIFLFLVCVCLLAAIACSAWEYFVGFKSRVYLPDLSSILPEGREISSLSIGGLYFFSYVIILNTVVPISLYVSVEVIRWTHSMWINWDAKMWYKVKGKDGYARARTTTLNEELGQIEYVFSDKTGTLTQNIMTFNKCSINGIFYGDCFDKDNNAIDPSPLTPSVDFSNNPYFEKSFKFYDPTLLEKSKQKDEHVCLFFRVLALCHTVMPAENDEGSLIYEAQSPDEAALVSAARNFSFVFKSRTPKSISSIENKKVEVYELLHILDFNNVRKRMSVIVKKNGIITLYCKGADNMIFERLNDDSTPLKEITTEHLTRCASEGLRTLCLSYRHLPEDIFKKWERKWLEASTAMENRDDKMHEAMEEIEVEMTLIGATAIEDKLQDYVPETIANLARAEMKIWVLTGDKLETALNIGYSCRLLTDEMAEVFIIEGEDKTSVRESLVQAKKRMGLKSKGNNHFPTSSSRADLISHNQLLDSPVSDENNHNMLDGDVSKHNRIFNPDGLGYALVINGNSLAFALQEDMEKLLFETATNCVAVICCRVTPLQKALVVQMVKNRKSAITLAIGDGANDVSMIRAAHIGVGISGQEGLQAVMASDFSIAQFRYLERLLLVHGRWSYVRMCKFLKYFFYKNFAFTLAHFWFAFFCGFSAQTVYDQLMFIALFNLVYTSMPILMLACFEQDVDDRYCIKYPKLYVAGQHNLLFNKKVFAQSVVQGVISSFIIFGIPFAAFSSQTDQFGVDLSDIRGVGVSVATCLIWGVTIQCALETQYWTWINHFFTWGSIILFMLIQAICYSDKLTFSFLYEYMGVTPQVMVTPGYWLCLLLSLAVLLLPILALKFYYNRVRPTLSTHLREQHSWTSKSRSDLSIIRASQKRPRSSIRSGYAFSHKEGFGDLITSGQMSQRSRPPSAAGRSEES